MTEKEFEKEINRISRVVLELIESANTDEKYTDDTLLEVIHYWKQLLMICKQHFKEK